MPEENYPTFTKEKLDEQFKTVDGKECWSEAQEKDEKTGKLTGGVPTTLRNVLIEVLIIWQEPAEEPEEGKAPKPKEKIKDAKDMVTRLVLATKVVDADEINFSRVETNMILERILKAYDSEFLIAKVHLMLDPGMLDK